MLWHLRLGHKRLYIFHIIHWKTCFWSPETQGMKPNNPETTVLMRPQATYQQISPFFQPFSTRHPDAWVKLFWIFETISFSSWNHWMTFVNTTWNEKRHLNPKLLWKGAGWRNYSTVNISYSYGNKRMIQKNQNSSGRSQEPWRVILRGEG